MSDPVRLIDQGGEGGLEKSLLESWAARQPTDGARIKTLAAVTAVSVAGGAVVAGGAGASIAPKAAAVVTSSLLKWLAIAGGIVATAGAIGYVAQRDASAPAPSATKTAPVEPVTPVTPLTPAVHAPHAPNAAIAREPSPEAPTGTASPKVEPAAPALAGTAKSAHASSSVSSPAGSLDEEVLAIDRARGSLAAGDYAGALDQAAAYDARYPAGALSQESAEIRIEALFRSGKRAQAEKLATKFLTQNPASPYARVIRALESSTTPTPE